MDDNPFADPAVQQVTEKSGAVSAGLEDYNPFADNSATRPTPQVRGAANPPMYQGPAMMSPTTMAAGGEALSPAPPPVYSESGQQKIDTAELQRRQEELERKAQELERREEALRAGPYNTRKNNWPPLPDKFCIGPCFYQDINVDIPSEFQRIVRLVYYVWMYHSVLLFANLLGGLALMIKFGEGSTFGLSLLFFVLFVPASYVCWFRPIYKAFRSDSSFNFFIFFFVFFFQLCVSVIQAIGIPQSGACGFFVGLSKITDAQGSIGKYVVGGLVLFIGLGFALAALADFILLIKVHRLYRSTGASFAKAQQEFTSGVMQNEAVQNVAANAAASAVQAQFQRQEPRY